MNKTVRLGAMKAYSGTKRIMADVFCKITYKDGELTITGVEGPTRGGNAIGACGQIVMSHIHNGGTDILPAEGWTRDSIATFFGVWDKYHLNHMRAGAPDQEAAIAEVKNTLSRTDFYNEACKHLYKLGILYSKCDQMIYLHGIGWHNAKDYMGPASSPRDIPGYKYGEAWVHADVTPEALDFLHSLPEADREPVWI